MPFRTILVGVDLTPASAQALARALELGERLGAQVHAAHVVDHACLRPEEELERIGAGRDREALERELVGQARAELEGVLARVPGAAQRLAGVHLRVGEAVDELLELAREIGADLLVVATHGRQGIDRLLQGSVAEALLERSPVPLLALRGGGATGPEPAS
ncbi:MAG: hypothetical protein KatS3mg102_0102 [Planctomycetota bacterium]|nr:MAG: hypothetical protein KatS3mg102_0102 [Planctomycetota bacterium]